MGIYDRDYYRQGGSGIQLRMPRTAITAIILINVVVFVAEVVDRSADGDRSDGSVVEWLAVHSHINPPEKSLARLHPAAREKLEPLYNPREDTLLHPWMWWQFLTCGFVHDPREMQHIMFNMLTLFFLGRDVEQWYGTREFVASILGDPRVLGVGMVGRRPDLSRQFSVNDIARRNNRRSSTSHCTVRRFWSDHRRGLAVCLVVSPANIALDVRPAVARLALGCDGDRL